MSYTEAIGQANSVRQPTYTERMRDSLSRIIEAETILDHFLNSVEGSPTPIKQGGTDHPSMPQSLSSIVNQIEETSHRLTNLASRITNTI